MMNNFSILTFLSLSFPCLNENHRENVNIKSMYPRWASWFMPVILVVQETKAGGSQVHGQPRKVSETQSQKQKEWRHE
jgi:hypothetical protein